MKRVPPDCSPRGGRASLDGALRILGPFRFETRAEARAAGADGEASREECEDGIRALAAAFNERKWLVENMPRVADVLNDLRSIESCVSKFMDRVDGWPLALRQEAVEALGEGAAGTFANAPASPYTRAEAADLASLVAWLESRAADVKPPEWMRELRALASAIGEARARVASMAGGAGDARPDKGGRNVLAKKAAGNPNHHLVKRCVDMLVFYKPGAVRSKTVGKLAEHVREYATGSKDPRTAGGAKADVDFVLGLFRTLNGMRVREWRRSDGRWGADTEKMFLAWERLDPKLLE